MKKIPEGQSARQFRKKITLAVNIRYLLFLPEGYYHSSEKYPLILFLHGAGERGHNLRMVKKYGPPKIVQTQKDFPFMVVSPQCHIDESWSIEVLDALLDQILEEYRADEDRIYVTGLSMGGFATWELALMYPNRFAAIAPICGGGNPRKACRIRHLPVWAFHGAKDQVVPLRKSEQMVNALKACGAKKVKLTVYPEAGHDSWTAAYSNPHLFKWFLKQHRKKQS